jgi:TIR domain
MNALSTPRAFLSHSWSDNARVRPLAVALRAHGVDVWFDQWEMGPGDSLVQKINEGLEQCAVFLVALSAASVASNWVREELSAAVVRRIEDHARLIPVRLDDTPVPAVIRHLSYVPLDPLDDAVATLLKTIYGVNDKPPIGAAPEFIQQRLERRAVTISGLSPDESALLRILVNQAQQHEHPFDQYVDTTGCGKQLQLDQTEFNDALDLLQERGAIKPLREHLGTLVQVKPRAWMYLIGELHFDLRHAMQVVAQAVVAHERLDGPTLERETGIPIEHLRIAVGVLDQQQLVRVELAGIGAGRPYGWAGIVATRRTREWLKMQDL